MQDFEDILEMFEDYKRDPRPMDQEPRNMDQEPRIPFAKGSIKATRDYLDSLEEGATINRKNILKKFKVDNSVLSKIFKAYEDKNFNFEKSPSILKGVIRNQPTERQSYLGKYLYNKDWKNLTDLIPKFYSDNKMKKTGLAGIFAASLELTKEGSTKILQEKIFEKIMIKKTNT